jgi:hypothetical protein
LPFFTLPLVYGPEMTTYRYEGLLQVACQTLLRFPTQAPLVVLRFPTQVSLTPCGSQVKLNTLPHASEQDTLLVASLISKQVVTYYTHGGTDCSRGLLLRTGPE